ncbi:FAD-binding oxidoreductase [Polaromonas sp. P1(28)-13]|nr:FAD-binding oxidoreductase [Polaromonas sp. P1(28)-13]
MQKFSIWSLLRNSMSYHEGWQKQWRSPEPKREYDVVIIGAGGHGLATAYYLAKEHGVRNIAVVERGYLGGGNTARNTTIVRSNYLWDESTALYEKSMKLWEGLSQDINYNVMFSQRGGAEPGPQPAGHAGHRAPCQREPAQWGRRRGRHAGADQGNDSLHQPEYALSGARGVAAASRRRGAP